MEMDMVADMEVNMDMVAEMGLVNWAQTFSTQSLAGFCIFLKLCEFISNLDLDLVELLYGDEEMFEDD